MTSYRSVLLNMNLLLRLLQSVLEVEDFPFFFDGRV